MTIVYIGLASIIISLVMLLALGKYVSHRHSSPEPGIDVAASLRELLIARAEGRIDQGEFDRRQAALHAAVLQSPQARARLTPQLLRRGWPLVAVLVLIAIYVGYAGFKGDDQVGAPEATFNLSPVEQPVKAPSGGDLNTVVKRLADKMAADPNNGEGWLLLAKTYNELHKYGEADAAYEKAAALLPADATMLADWADTHVMARDRQWDDAGRKIVKRAVAADPKHVKALALAGSEAFDRADYKAAIDFWKRMKAAAPADSMDGKLADANIAEANAMLSGKKPAVAEQGVSTGVVAGVVTLNPKLKGKVSAADTLFLTAKAPDGSGPPLAVWRYQGNDFPIEFRLDDSSAIMPGRTISQFPEVLISAKVSKSGSAEPAKGDILAAPVKTKLGNTTLAIELNSER
jgi:cytochrome c-type biogenesis protein CcmH